MLATPGKFEQKQARTRRNHEKHEKSMLNPRGTPENPKILARTFQNLAEAYKK